MVLSTHASSVTATEARAPRVDRETVVTEDLAFDEPARPCPSGSCHDRQLRWERGERRRTRQRVIAGKHGSGGVHRCRAHPWSLDELAAQLDATRAGPDDQAR